MSVFVLGSYVNANCLSVKQLPANGESLAATAKWVEHGGKGLNLAVGLHRLEVKLHLLLGIGNDVTGTTLLDWLSAEGLDTRWIVRLGNHSGFGVGLIAEDGGNVIVVHPGANALLDATHVQATTEALTRCQLVCAQFEVMDAPIVEAFQQARQQGIKTLLNPSPWRFPNPVVLALTDILVLNEAEVAACFGIGNVESLSLVQWLRVLPTFAWKGALLVVTLAERGCVAWQRGQAAMHAPAWPIALIDPTGAGDAFTAGLICALLRDYPLNQALRFANACGAMVAARQGVLPALPTLEQASGFVATQHVTSFSK